MKRKHIANLMMVAIILVIACGGLYAVGSIRGWFGAAEDAAILTDVRGIVNLRRDNVAYPVEGDTALRRGDALSCDAGATAVIRTDGGSFTLGGNAEVTIGEPSSHGFSAEVTFGEIFANNQGRANLSFDNTDIALEDTVALLSVRGGAQTVTVFDGAVADASAGQTLNWVGRDRSVGTLNMQSLNDFAISQLRSANRTRTLCVTDDALDQLEQERSAAIRAQLAGGSDDGLSCTIAIYCDTILDNWDNLDTAKASYVPDDGIILAPTTVEFEDGETVFDVLNRVCETCEIQLESSWTPMYDSYYVEGIHHLYEFDCGFQSGWMYKVNEWFPNYGCSEYRLTGGESIVWCYTCNGYGEDVGGGAY